MLRNIKDYLASHEGLNFFDLFPLILFSVLMILILIYVFSMSKEHVDEMGKYPLNDKNDLDYGKKE